MSKPLRLASVMFALNSSLVGAQTSLENAREAGARYAQALGAAETCGSLRVSPMVEALKAKFQGDNLNVFEQQAANVYAAWHKVKNCANASDPNPCRIMIQLSCQSAVSEIGPGGSVIPNLLEIGSH